MRIARHLPSLIGELTRAFHLTPAKERAETASLLVSALRTADAVAYKYGARDLSARLVDLMRWAVPYASDPLLDATVAYVRTETFFAARAHVPGLRAAGGDRQRTHWSRRYGDRCVGCLAHAGRCYRWTSRTCGGCGSPPRGGFAPGARRT
ncbi:hypothetical protein SBI_04726 [Streptomyces bingchenggensis BCW-1]|uniref:Uncharacterized protein n=1 Tax=Streptomyces bingchenggensis (strain BCW-1) TaxID=749414 RepID=D7BZB0_STRBB|nr:hypothetical protein SBI_04726 [Streptomyces bingchenggensis BCW-1]